MGKTEKKTAAPKLLLPRELEGHRAKFETAMAIHVPAVWPEEEKVTYLEAEQPDRLVGHLVTTTHPDLVGAEIKCLFKKKITDKWAVASKASPKITFLASVDFLIDINHDAYRFLRAEQRIALVDHELTHFGRDMEKGWVTIPHDVEEFGSIARRWGLWRNNLRDFHVAMQAGAAQIDLFSVVPAPSDAIVEKIIDGVAEGAKEHFGPDTEVERTPEGAKLTLH